MEVKNKIIERYKLLRCDVQLGIRTGRIDPIEGQLWLDRYEQLIGEVK